MSLPKLEHREVLALIVAGAGLGSKLVSLTPFWGWAIGLGLAAAAVSFVVRQGWKPSISPQ